MPIIEFDNVRFSYGDNECALDGMTLSIEQGEFACVLGGNGSGNRRSPSTSTHCSCLTKAL